MKILILFPLQAVGDAFNEGLYEEQARLRGIPLLESKPKYQMRKMTAKDASGQRVNYTLMLQFSYIQWLLNRMYHVTSV